MWGGVWGGGGIQQMLSGYYCYMEHFDHELCWSCYAGWCLTWCSYCIQYIVWDEAIYPYPKFIGEVWEYISNSPHTSLGILLLSHAEIKVNPYRYKGPLFDCPLNIFQNGAFTSVTIPSLVLYQHVHRWFGVSRWYLPCRHTGALQFYFFISCACSFRFESSPINDVIHNFFMTLAPETGISGTSE